MDDLKRVAQQFVDAANVAGPSSYIPEVELYSQAGSKEDIIARGLSGSGSLAGQRAKEADEADEAARRAKMQAIADKLDPSKYRRVRKDDGGFAFYDPSGKEIGIDQYARFTGQRLVDILKDSENPVDLEYVNDWKNMNDLMQSMYNGESDVVNAFVQQNPDLRDKRPQDLAAELIQKYPHMYGVGSYDQTLRNRGWNKFSFARNRVEQSGGGSGGGWRPS